MDYIPSYSDSLRADIRPSYSDSLMHHGIKGMHWGIRRYQNTDGSLTAAGKKRYSWNPIARWKEKQEEKQRQRDEAIAKAKQQREQMMHDQDVWDDICTRDSYESSKYEKPLNKAIEEYDDAYDKYGFNHPNTQAAYDKAYDLAYKHGYDTGKKAAKKFTDDYDSETLNRVLDHSLEEYVDRNEISKLGDNYVEKFALYCGRYNAAHF